MKFAFMRADDTTFATVEVPMDNVWDALVAASPELVSMFYRSLLWQAVGTDPKAFQGIDRSALENRALLTGDAAVFAPQELDLEEFEELTVAVWRALDPRIDFEAELSDFFRQFQDSVEAMFGFYQDNAQAIPSQNGLRDGCEKVLMALIDSIEPVEELLATLARSLQSGEPPNAEAIASNAGALAKRVDGIDDAIVAQQKACLPKDWDSEDAYPLGLDGAKRDVGFATALEFLGHADEVNSLAWSLADRLQSLAASGKG